MNELNSEFKEVKHNSEDYWKTVALRDKVLRKPLGLAFTDVELQNENDQIHYAAFIDAEVKACLVLLPLDKDRIKMRQVCTHPDFQGTGLGKKLAAFVEQKAKEMGYKVIECNARKTAVPFYEKMNYKIISELFYEVGIEHYKMEKTLKQLSG